MSACRPDGAARSTGQVNLNNSKNNFERAAVDVFSFPALPNVYDVTRIRIGHDNSGAGAAWHLNKVCSICIPAHLWN